MVSNLDSRAEFGASDAYIERSGSNITFKDANNGSAVTLSDLKLARRVSTLHLAVAEHDTFAKSPPPTLTSRSGTTNTGTTVAVFAFDDTTEQFVVYDIELPPDLDASGTVNIRFQWIPATASSNNVVWKIYHASVDSGQSFDVALTTATVTSAGSATTNVISEAVITQTVSTLGWSAGDHLILHISRDASNGSDTLVGNAHLISGVVELPLKNSGGAGGSLLAIKSAGSTVSGGPFASINFTGSGVSVAANGSTADVTITGGGGGGSLTVKSEGTTISSAATVLNFQGHTVTESPSGTANISVPVVSDSINGLLTKEDKIKLDTIDPGAQINPVIQDHGSTIGIGAITMDFEGPHVSTTFDGSNKTTVTVQYTGDQATTTLGYFKNSTTNAPIYLRDTQGVTIQNDGATQAVNMATSAATELTVAGSVVVKNDSGLTIKNTAATNSVSLTASNTAELTITAASGVKVTGAVAFTSTGNISTTTGDLVLTPSSHVYITQPLDVASIITHTGTNANLTMTPDGTGIISLQKNTKVTTGHTFTVTDLSAGRLVYTGTAGVLASESELAYDDVNNRLTVGILRTGTFTDKEIVFWNSSGDIVGASTLTFTTGTNTLSSTNLTATAALTAASITDSGLTAGRVPFAGTGGLISDTSTFTFNSGTNTLSSTNLTATAALTAASITDSGLTAGRVPVVGTSGLIGDSANLTFNTGTNTLTTQNLTISGLTATRIPFIGTAGAVSSDSNLVWDNSSKILKTLNFRADGGTITGPPGIFTGTFGSNGSGQLVDAVLTPSSSTTGAVQIAVTGQVSTGSTLTGAVLYAGTQSLTKVSNSNGTNLNLSGTNFDVDFPAASVGAFGQGSQAGGSGYAVGGFFWGGNSTGSQFGSVSKAFNASGARTIGAVGYGGGATNNVGGWFTLSSTDPSPSFSAGLVVSNGSATGPSIARFLDDTTLVYDIKDGGDHDFFDHQILNVRLENLSSAPPAGSVGRVFFRTDTSPPRVQFDDGSTISDITSGSSHASLTGLNSDDHTQYSLSNGTRAYTGDLSMGSHKITSLATPTAGTDAANKDYVDTAVGSGSGVTMVRLLTVPSFQTTDAVNTNQIADSYSIAPYDFVTGNAYRINVFFIINGAAGQSATVALKAFDGTDTVTMIEQGRTLVDTGDNIFYYSGLIACASNSTNSGVYMGSGFGWSSAGTGENPSTQASSTGAMTLDPSQTISLRLTVLFPTNTGKTLKIQTITYEKM